MGRPRKLTDEQRLLNWNIQKLQTKIIYHKKAIKKLELRLKELEKQRKLWGSENEIKKISQKKNKNIGEVGKG